MAYLVTRSHSPTKVKQMFENVGKWQELKVELEKQRTVNKNTIIFQVEYNPRGPGVNAIIKRHEHVFQSNTVLKELFVK